MSKIVNQLSAPKLRWIKPALKRLGTIADVAGGGGSLNNGSSPNLKS